MSVAVQKSIARLRTKMLRAAKTFPDYNFRSYFVRHVKDDFSAMERWSVEEQQRFLVEEGAKKLSEMRRMALISRLYTTQPVFFEKRATPQFESPSKPTKDK